MKFNLLVLFIVSISIFACSTDKIDIDQLIAVEAIDDVVLEDSKENSTPDNSTVNSTTVDNSPEDSGEDVSSEISILGSWRAIDFVSTDPNSSNINLGADILTRLTGEECYIITFTFNEDSSVVAENAVNYLEVNATPAGLVVPCPSDIDSKLSNYAYDGTTLTIIDSSGDTLDVKVSIDKDTMSVDAADLDIPNFNGVGELIFEKY